MKFVTLVFAAIMVVALGAGAAEDWARYTADSTIVPPPAKTQIDSQDAPGKPAPKPLKPPVDAVPPSVTNPAAATIPPWQARETELIKKIEVKPDPQFLGPPAPGQNRPGNPSK